MKVTIRNANGKQGTKDVCKNIRSVSVQPASGSPDETKFYATVIDSQGWASLWVIDSIKQISVKQ